ncbi:alanine--tRNA ligase, partial [Chloroflexota bacterium]
MNEVTGDEIRKAFLRFFEGKGHTVVPSASLVPQDDPTLLLTSAGMVQIKPYFLGLATPPNVRLASCQKCFRTSDVDSVGDSTHLTFFEMLGNFSVGDYFKREAIEWAWEFVTQWLELPIDRLWITVFLDDDEAVGWWQEIGVRPERILRLGEEDNFWGPAGESGPCGPCSEILYDFGEEYRCGRSDCGPTCDCGRFSEIWNLVFTQYDEDREGKRTPLPKPNIDTGMGLERVAAVMQGKATLYETDLFAPLIEVVSQITGKEHGQDKTVDQAMRIVVEHGRAGTFLVADGVVPGNEGRGYVLRRVIRRAALFGRKLGLEDAFLTRLADVVVETMGHVYPELKMNRELIRNVVALEEERFHKTLDRGLAAIRGAINYRARHAGAIPDIISFVKEHKPSAENASRILEQYGFVAYDPEAEPFEQIGEELAAASASDLLYRSLEHQGEESLPDVDAAFSDFRDWATTISGAIAFTLYDTYGFPQELTTEIAAERGFTVDLDG